MGPRYRLTSRGESDPDSQHGRSRYISEILAAVVFVVALPLMASVVVYRMVLTGKRKQIDPETSKLI
jgi:hypothetical protein